MSLSFACALFFMTIPALAASAAEWRTRSVYQLITDRYALPSDSASLPPTCDPGMQTWCGGTWSAIRENLDYIQNAGFTAVWISPVNKNYDGPRTNYGDAYTGYWVTDVSRLNPRFGSPNDLKDLAVELHRREMFLMVDLVLNNVMAPTLTPDYSEYFFKDARQYHPYCPIKWGNRTSEMDCWLGDTVVPLPDVNTEVSSVSKAYQSWISHFIQEYSIDGLRIDAAKHAPTHFWASICAAAEVFCMGEVFGPDINQAAAYQGSEALDSVLNYPLYDAIVQAFALPGPRNMSHLVNILHRSKEVYEDISVLGSFLENQDLPRWSNISVDMQSLLNALTFIFIIDGIPIVYYGQEQMFSGNGDPWNREPLWSSNYSGTPVYASIAKLNQLRNFVLKQTDSSWGTMNAKVLTVTDSTLAFIRGNIIAIVTNIGSPPKNASVSVFTPWKSKTGTIDILSCTQWVIGSNGTLSVDYSQGGRAIVLVPMSDLHNSGLCGYSTTTGKGTESQVSWGKRICSVGPLFLNATIAVVLLFMLVQ